MAGGLMPVSTVLGLTASAWAIMMALAPLLQVREIRARGSSSGISAATYRVLLVGFGLWAAYGVADENLVLVVPNLVAGVVAIATLVVIARYRRGA